MEDMVKVETGFGRGVLGFVLKKILEGKFGVKFVNFDLGKVVVYSPADGRDLSFDIRIQGLIAKNDIIKIVRGGE